MSGTGSQVLPTLASQPMPRRVRDLLESILKVASFDLQRGISAAIIDFEQQLHRHIERTANGADRQRLQQGRAAVERSHGDLARFFLNAVEAELANLHAPQIVRGHLKTLYRTGDELALVNDHEIEETSALTDAATRAELQNSLPLFLLGQRFGVLAARPAFDAETLPIGPQALCRSIRAAVERLGLDVEVRLVFYRSFERHVMPSFGSLVEIINGDLARNGVLPNLKYIPLRARRSEQKPGASIAAAHAAADRRPGAAGRATPASGKSDSDSLREAAELLLAMASTPDPSAGSQGLELLRQLMASRRGLLGKLNPDRSGEGREHQHMVSGNDIQAALRVMQSKPTAPLRGHGRSAARNIGHLKQDLLALLRQLAPDQEAPALADQQHDSLDLLAMLYDNLLKDIDPGSHAAALLAKLQVPLMRVAVQDSTFFTRQEHPARQTLNAVAETGVHWLGDDDSDANLLAQMHSLVDHAVQDYQGDASVFKNVLQELIAHLQILSRKAEVSERRNVEAARGREKLTIAREHAAICIEALIRDHKLPRFTRTMLSQAWADVLALTALRQGQDSPVWLRQLQVAENLIEIAQRPADRQDPHDNDLQREVEDGLSKVGYQGDDVQAIATRLVHPNSSQHDDASSRTELTMRLKARTRLGLELRDRQAHRVALTPEEQAQMQLIQQVPVGSWFEFTGQPGSRAVRRRLAWLSTATGDALFVNQRGQKTAELELEELSRLMVAGRARLVEAEKGTLVDRAWEGVLTALRSFATPERPERVAE